MGAFNIQAALSRRLHPISPRVARVVSSADATFDGDEFVLRYDTDDNYRVASASRVLIAEEVSSLTRTLLPLRISSVPETI